MNFARIASGIDVTQALAELDARPELWGQNRGRLDVPGSPHAASEDIWLRFRPREELTSPAAYGEPHFAAFWPAWYQMPALRPIVFGIMARVQAVYLGGILLTRIPAGASILPHVDRGWHPEWNNIKCYVILRANARCVNRCGDESVVMAPGEAWLFRNDITHSVENHGDTERIALIVTMRVE